MSWRFPRFRLRDGNALSTDDTNESFLESADEMSGRLNEHNWASGSIPARTDVQDDAAFVWHQVSRTVDFNAVGPFDPLFHKVEPGASWITLNGMILTITGPDALYWIHGSTNWRRAAAYTGIAAYVRWVIKLDGQPILESVGGGLEEDATTIRAQSIQQNMFPPTMSALVAVSAGQHIVEMCVRSDTTTSVTDNIYFGNRELICLEMRR